MEVRNSKDQKETIHTESLLMNHSLFSTNFSRPIYGVEGWFGQESIKFIWRSQWELRKTSIPP